jgi:hypothetical protein
VSASPELAVAVAALLLGCTPAPPTYGQDVGPLLARRCGGCHDEGGVPPRLASYQDAAAQAAAIALCVERRQMPPGSADGSGWCGAWTDGGWLPDREVATLADWASRGTPPGRAVRPIRRPSLDGLTLGPAGSFTPGLGAAATRCFQVETGHDLLISALAVRSDPPAAVEQAALYAGAPRGRQWPCPLEPAAPLLAAWSWAAPVARLPGVRLPRGPLILRVRYNLLGRGLGAGPVSVQLIVKTAASGEATVAELDAGRVALPPGQRQAEARAALAVQSPGELGGFIPRMGALGRVLQLSLVRGGQARCLAHFGHWDPSAQRTFRAATPVALQPGDRLELSCLYDTRGQAAPVADEGCAAVLYFAAARS